MKRNPRRNTLHCKSRVLYGLRPLNEYLRTQPETIETIHALRLQKTEGIIQSARKLHIPVQYQSVAFLDTLTHGGNHQGIAAQMRPFQYAVLTDLIQSSIDCLLVLDEIVDPQNLGALLRTAESAKVGGVILTKRRSAQLSASVEKAAAGATAYLPICRVENLQHALRALKQANFWIIGLNPQATSTVYDLDMQGKVALVLGGEGRGIRPLVQRTCDYLVSIPMEGRISSLNVSVAGAIVLYERLRQIRKP